MNKEQLKETLMPVLGALSIFNEVASRSGNVPAKRSSAEAMARIQMVLDAQERQWDHNLEEHLAQLILPLPDNAAKPNEGLAEPFTRRQFNKLLALRDARTPLEVRLAATCLELFKAQDT